MEFMVFIEFIRFIGSIGSKIAELIGFRVYSLRFRALWHSGSGFRV